MIANRVQPERLEIVLSTRRPIYVRIRTVLKTFDEGLCIGDEMICRQARQSSEP